jgi:uncharacterized membrane protein
MDKDKKRHSSPREGKGGQLPEVLADNIRLLLEQHQKDLQRGSMIHAVVRRIATFVGSVEFIYLHLLVYGTWVFIALSSGSSSTFDLHLSKIAVASGLEALFLSACIVFNQNRNQAIADERAQLHLHISLLAEREATRMMQLVAAITEHLGLPANDPDLKELMEDLQPKDVLDEIKRKKADEPGDG